MIWRTTKYRRYLHWNFLGIGAHCKHLQLLQFIIQHCQRPILIMLRFIIFKRNWWLFLFSSSIKRFGLNELRLTRKKSRLRIYLKMLFKIISSILFSNFYFLFKLCVAKNLSNVAASSTTSSTRITAIWPFFYTQSKYEWI